MRKQRSVPSGSWRHSKACFAIDQVKQKRWVTPWCLDRVVRIPRYGIILKCNATNCNATIFISTRSLEPLLPKH